MFLLDFDFCCHTVFAFIVPSAEELVLFIFLIILSSTLTPVISVI